MAQQIDPIYECKMKDYERDELRDKIFRDMNHKIKNALKRVDDSD